MSIDYSKEFKLSSSEYKFLQYLKIQEKKESLAEISNKININERTLRNITRILEGLYVIEIERNSTKKNGYSINDYDLWRIDV